MIDFNGMSTYLGLFYAKRLENYFQRMPIFTFLCSYFCRFFAHKLIKYE